MPPIILPPPLKPGDLLRVIAPSGALREFAAFEKSLEIWKAHGYNIQISDNLESRHGYLAGNDDHRRQQLAAAWHDPECRGIICARGGFGSTRILEDWNWEQKTADPKWLIGFSDITALLWSLYKAGISGVHGPVLTTLKDEPEWSIKRLLDILAGRAIAPLKGNGWGGGTVTGVLLPGNLTVATHLLGTPLLPDLDGVILAFEDVTEPPYRIDRMLTQWRLSGMLSKVRGIALGGFTKCDAPPNIPSLSIEEVLGDRLSDLNIPIVSDLPFGHDSPNAALPVGVQATLDADQGILEIVHEIKSICDNNEQ
ncbi:LD-carboxypeptidase [Anabaena aphanizomenioides LEGE 00250]|uniref:LD-carboxypeptidase n=1 Tax=Sphaerospermopsis aphanizomenoides LEGE 00250 TaxID=2777972 RepID=A0ABR9VAV4_9CYAN|nr:LD-carboxypeptidase [Sphaerospermopsis aphanizomenoides]MBE9235624.1 LD-carboxypeptidase [Sphaerospermopsis aphanizomenoides LEGE 00250]